MKDAAKVILGLVGPPKSSDKGKADSARKAAAKALLEAIKSGDVDAFDEALTLRDKCKHTDDGE